MAVREAAKVAGATAAADRNVRAMARGPRAAHPRAKVAAREDVPSARADGPTTTGAVAQPAAVLVEAGRGQVLCT